MPEPKTKHQEPRNYAPMVYGMTPGETALWLNSTLVPKVNLRIAKMQGYNRNKHRCVDGPPWMRPSPSIVSWESAICREEFFDKLHGTDSVRISLKNGEVPKSIANQCKNDPQKFNRIRRKHLLYSEESA